MFPHPPLWLVLIAFVCALGPLVFFHELGHYLVARLFRIPAETFSIGFGREIVGWTDKQGTRWKVAWIPLGGYVKFVGDMSPASEPGDLENIPAGQRDRAFQVRPVWQRFLVVLAGPMANFLLAILIFSAFFSFGGTPRTNVVAELVPHSAAAAAGIAPGDRILSIDGRATPTFEDISSVVLLRPDEQVSIKIERGHAVRLLNAKLGSAEVPDATGRKMRAGVLGIRSSTEIGEPVPVYQAIPMATDQTIRMTASIVDGLSNWSKARSRQSNSAVRSRSPGSPGKARSSACFRSSDWLRCSQLISDSSTSCQFRCWMEAISSSMPSRQFGAVRSAPRRSNGLSAAALRSSSRSWCSPRSTIWVQSASGTGFNA